MTSKQNWSKILLITFVFLMVLSGCSTMMAGLFGIGAIETETSKMLQNAANEILLTRPNGMSVDQFQAAFELRFPGLRSVTTLNITTPWNFEYEGKEYRMSFNTAREGVSRTDLPNRLTSVSKNLEMP
jgi:Co/Zn/Cd efflux system component